MDTESTDRPHLKSRYEFDQELQKALLIDYNRKLQETLLLNQTLHRNIPMDNAEFQGKTIKPSDKTCPKLEIKNQQSHNSEMETDYVENRSLISSAEGSVEPPEQNSSSDMEGGSESGSIVDKLDTNQESLVEEREDGKMVTGSAEKIIRNGDDKELNDVRCNKELYDGEEEIFVGDNSKSECLSPPFRNMKRKISEETRTEVELPSSTVYNDDYATSKLYRSPESSKRNEMQVPFMSDYPYGSSNALGISRDLLLFMLMNGAYGHKNMERTMGATFPLSMFPGLPFPPLDYNSVQAGQLLHPAMMMLKPNTDVVQGLVQSTNKVDTIDTQDEEIVVDEGRETSTKDPVSNDRITQVTREAANANVFSKGHRTPIQCANRGYGNSIREYQQAMEGKRRPPSNAEKYDKNSSFSWLRRKENETAYTTRSKTIGSSDVTNCEVEMKNKQNSTNEHNGSFYENERCKLYIYIYLVGPGKNLEACKKTY